MSANVLSLPIDIPWKRLCVSEDMIDPKVCDRNFPYRWRSSVAIFSYQPPEDQQTYEGMIVSYLKVACTITGYQPNPEEVGLKNRRVDSYWNTQEPIRNYKDMVSKYYGCHGALLEVAVAPRSTEGVPLSNYPYFADFEPKKRELYEIVTETGEIMSRTLENVNVHKGGTTTNSREVVDSTTISGEFKNLSLSPSGEGLSNAQVGLSNTGTTRDVNQEQYVNTRTTDQAREARETFSHSTQLTQMYHQFTSYHLGTNRAVFFMLPRPHMVQSEYTFVNGPRLLEGIQEIFLVVVRPKEIEDIRVEAYLETAHVANVFDHDIYNARPETFIFQPLIATVEDKDPTIDLGGTDNSYTSTKKRSDTYIPPDGWEVDTGRPDGGYKIESMNKTGREDLGYVKYQVTAEKDKVTVYGEVTARFVDNNTGNDIFNASLDMVITIYIRSKKPIGTKYSQDLFLTGRGVCCPPITIDKKEAAITYEANVYLLDRSNTGSMTVRDANHLGAEVGRMMVQSINHPDRYPIGEVSFTETQFLARNVAMVMQKGSHPDNQEVTAIKGLDPLISEKVARVAPRINRGRLLLMSLDEQIDRFDLNREEAVTLRRAALGLEGPLPEPQRRWDLPGSRRGTEQTVPNVIGLSLEDAGIMLREVFLSTGNVAYQDSEQPKDTVLNQSPNAGETVFGESVVNLVVATGISVRIPDVVCKPLSQALVMLRDAGLESEPEICFISSEGSRRNQVIEVSPGMRTYVTPHACVTLQVSSGSISCETSD